MVRVALYVFEDEKSVSIARNRETTTNKNSHLNAISRLPFANRTNTMFNGGLEKKLAPQRNNVKSCNDRRKDVPKRLTERTILTCKHEEKACSASISKCQSVDTSPQLREVSTKDKYGDGIEQNPFTLDNPRSTNLNTLRRSIRATLKSPTIGEDNNNVKFPEARTSNNVSPSLSVTKNYRTEPKSLKSRVDNSFPGSQTPKSLLKEEMENGADISLLCSPLPMDAPKQKSNFKANERLKDSQYGGKMRNLKGFSTKPRRRLEMIAAASKNRLDNATQHEINNTKVLRSSPLESIDRVDFSSPILTGSANDNSRATRQGDIRQIGNASDSEMFSKSITGAQVGYIKSDFNAKHSVCVETDPKNVTCNARLLDSTQKLCGKNLDENYHLSKFGNIDVVQLEENPNANTDGYNSVSKSNEPWYRAMPDSIIQPNKTVSIQSFTPKGNGFCMDLTNIFIDAALSNSTMSKANEKTLLTARKREYNPSGPKETELRTQGTSMANIHVESDEWASKQCETFRQWLNYTFEPNEDKDVDESVSNSDHEIALRSLVVHRRMARTRYAAACLYKGDRMAKIKAIVSSEVQKGRIAIRSDRSLHADIMMRNQLLSLLFSYSTPWLRLGLETVFGQTILPIDTTAKGSVFIKAGAKIDNKLPYSRMELALRNFITDRVLADSKILAKYTKGKCMVPSGRFEKKYNAELSARILNRLLVLILFLDLAKEANVLDKVPNLFLKSAPVKSTREVLLTFCREFLQAEGDFVKHLTRVGLKVFFKQECVDELNFTVSNLATDLRDGTRLVKLAEILTGIEPKSLLCQLRLPVVSRLQKLHNVGLALKELARFGVPLPSDIAAHHIVDGHRQLVLKLLWAIVAHCCLKTLLNIEKVEMEIERITKKRREKVTTLDEGSEPALYKLKDVILRWCQAICSRWGISANNFSQDFSNGSAVCHLIHFYHPTLLRIDEIYVNINDVSSLRRLPVEEQEKVCCNEEANARLANRKMSQIGGIPEMVPVCNSLNAPEEKSMLFCLTFLCSRLIESNHEIRACIIIQNWFRPYYQRKKIERKRKAAFKIWLVWKKMKENYYINQKAKYQDSVLIIENFIASHRNALYRLMENRKTEEIRHSATLLIQKAFRRHAARKTLNRVMFIHKIFTKLQAVVRGQQARHNYSHFRLQVKAANIIQRAWKKAKSKIRKRKQAAIQIQRLWRGFWSQLQFQIDVFDIIAVQSCFRRKRAERVFAKSLQAIFSIQRATRQYLLRNRMKREWAAVKIQCQMRKYKAQLYKSVCRQRSILIQCRWRTYCAQISKMCILDQKRRINSAMRIQSTWRQYTAHRALMVRRLLKKQIISSIIIQSRFRAFLAKIILRKLSFQRRRGLAIVSLQTYFRRLLALNVYRAHQQQSVRFKSAILIQRIWHMHKALTRSNLVRRANNIFIDSYVLAQHETNAAIIIQKTWRGKKAFILLKVRYSAATTIQSIARMHSKKKFLRKTLTKVIAIQAIARMVSARKVYDCFVTKVVRCQSIYRRWLAARLWKRQLLAIIKIQCFIRCNAAKEELSNLEEMSFVRLQATVLIQRVFRKKVYHERFMRTMQQIVFLQSLCRRNMHKDAVLRRKSALIKIQNAYRACLARARYNREKTAALNIQSLFRGYLVQSELRANHRAATLIQSRFRTFVHQTDYKLLILDVILTQIVVRQWIARKMVLKRLKAKIFLQSVARGFLDRLLISRIKAARTIQRLFRGHCGRTLLLHHLSARKIQKTWRCYNVHCDFLVLCIKTIYIQANIRKCLQMRKFSKQRDAIILLQSVCRQVLAKIHVFRMDAAAVVLQSFTRMAHDRKHFLVVRERHRRVSKLQSVVRMHISRNAYGLQRIAVNVLQRNTRGFLVRLNARNQFAAIVQIQRIWRGFFAYTEFAFKVLSAVKLQSVARMYCCQNEYEKLRLEQVAKTHSEFRCARMIQREYRRFQIRRNMEKASHLIQKTFRSYLSKLVFGKFRQGVTRLQAAIRGRATRSKSSKKIKEQAGRLVIAHSNAKADPRMQLGHRTSAALDVLMKSRSLSEIMSAICLLELATRYSEVCCTAFAQAGAPDILFPLIRSCNRSLPHIQILRYVLLTLSNVAKYDNLLPSMASTDAVEVFLDLVQMFRDKEGIFPLAAALLERVMTSNSVIKLKCSSRENQKRLLGIVQLIVRKQSISGLDSVTSLDHTGFPGISSRTRSNRKRTPAKSFISGSKLQDSNTIHHGLRALQRVLATMTTK